MYLIFDASANGKPKSYKAALDDSFSWPRLLHLSWITLNEELKPINDFNCVIKPEGFSASEEAMKMHHLELEQLDKGDELQEVLTKFDEAVRASEFIFSHNLQFNESIVGAEYYRKTLSNPLISAEKYCIMQEGTYFCKLPGKRGYKWPSLQELHNVCFKQGFTPGNNARADAIAATRCFIYLKRARAFEDIFFD